MKKVTLIFAVTALIAFASCKGNPNTTSGDSTGTGAGGSRVPQNVVADTTKHDTTNADSSQK